MNLLKNLSSPKTQKREKRKSSHNYIIIIEFKFAKTLTEVAKMQKQGEEQVAKYAETYANTNKKVITAVFVADDEQRQIVM